MILDEWWNNHFLSLQIQSTRSFHDFHFLFSYINKIIMILSSFFCFFPIWSLYSSFYDLNSGIMLYGPNNYDPVYIILQICSIQVSFYFPGFYFHTFIIIYHSLIFIFIVLVLFLMDIYSLLLLSIPEFQELLDYWRSLFRRSINSPVLQFILCF